MSEQTILQSLVVSLIEDFGYPYSLKELLKQHVGALQIDLTPKRDVNHYGTIRWNEWSNSVTYDSYRGRRGEVKEWRYAHGHYDLNYVIIDDLNRLFRQSVTKEWKCDIRDITAVSFSKAKLECYETLDHFAEERCREYIGDVSIAGLRKNLSHYGIRILQENSDDYLIKYEWDRRLFWVNADGSHHFSAARYIAGELGVPVDIKSKLVEYKIDRSALRNLALRYEAFVLSDQCDRFSVGFHHFMRQFKASYIKKRMLSPYEHSFVILLPVEERRSMKVAEVLREHGAFDLWSYFVKFL